MRLFEKEKSPGIDNIVISFVLLLVATACREIKPTPESFTPTPQTSIKSSPSPTPQNTPTASPGPTKITQTPGIPTTEDEYLRITSERDTYSISDTINLNLIIIGELVTLQGPCNMWFEIKEGENWEKVGHCERTFDDEPYPLLQGEEIKLNLPMTNESEYSYSYTYILTPGTYRYAVTYWNQSENLLIYSPEFQITEFQFTEDDNIRISSLNDTYSITDTIRFDLTVIGKSVYFHAPCDMWFERKEGQDWVMVGYCPDTNFTDEPFPVAQGEEIKLNLPMASESEYHYSYKLTPGTYRYAITYWEKNKHHLIYSPEFTIVE